MIVSHYQQLLNRDFSTLQLNCDLHISAHSLSTESSLHWNYLRLDGLGEVHTSWMKSIFGENDRCTLPWAAVSSACLLTGRFHEIDFHSPMWVLHLGWCHMQPLGPPSNFHPPSGGPPPVGMAQCSALHRWEWLSLVPHGWMWLSLVPSTGGYGSVKSQSRREGLVIPCSLSSRTYNEGTYAITTVWVLYNSHLNNVDVSFSLAHLQSWL